ncbi:hypothetical protein CCR91_06065 [Thiorhodovibrio winogradskyi]|nr:hypothetical protein [Thiorhodovibrio winogradskyi]
MDAMSATCVGTYEGGSDCFKSDNFNNDTGNQGVLSEDSQPFLANGGSWELLDKTDENSSVFEITANVKEDSGDWNIITPEGKNIWNEYSAVMVTFKGGNGNFGNYEGILLMQGKTSGTFDWPRGSLSHASLWGTNDISSVPIPAAAWLFGSALLGLVGFGARSKKVSKKI